MGNCCFSSRRAEHSSGSHIVYPALHSAHKPRFVSLITFSTKIAVLNQTCAGQVEAVAGSGFGTGRKFLVRLPADMPAGVAYLELQQGPFVGGACPALVMPAELTAAAGELLHALEARDAMLQCSSSGGRLMAPNSSELEKRKW